ncbi:related to formamidopyrimidine-DNA glycosylase [Ramularia collo-cygni]|uniref:Related to formamidopyrimidine-DNA glycosylase n=1 Tax=Ramularia collo-cygni TaxID=112498 RepID=A0A2D3V706_9PEZI|nr:related to formamidopyrimidine-DNA glycosylase [Ramularia collo-cygni]CZT17279.1 related to formamidopyrimidine-DNA glycosylase [Ramularia collo-cygni]
MPEIGEVARIVHYLRKHLVNRTVTSCEGFVDDIVYGKVGCSAEAFSNAFTGRKVMSAGQQGKYFYVTLDKAPHSIMHLGMTGWIKFNAEETGYYRQAVKKDGEKEDWPPKYMKWLIKCDAEGDREALEVAFVDPRRLAKIRLVDCEADKIRSVSPLKENGPDPVIDKDVVTLEWLTALLRRKKVPVKALILDQANISGIGNWVADEILYQAKLHPEQYSNTFSDDEIARLREAMFEVTGLACEVLADSEQFPQDWLMKYRWDKGKKASNVLPNGAKIVHLTVGGRTSAIVPSVQKKTGNVAADVKGEDSAEEKTEPVAKGRKRKSKAVKEEDEELGNDDEEEEVMPAKKTRSRKVKSEAADSVPTEPKRASRGEKAAIKNEEPEEEVPGRKKKAQSKPIAPSKPVVPGERKSTRNKA